MDKKANPEKRFFLGAIHRPAATSLMKGAVGAADRGLDDRTNTAPPLHTSVTVAGVVVFYMNLHTPRLLPEYNDKGGCLLLSLNKKEGNILATTNFTNTAIADGIINTVATDLTGAVTIQMVTGLAMTKTANKQSWANGELTYTIDIDNTLGTEDYTGITVNDILDPAIAVLVPNSVERDGGIESYTYNDTTGELSIPQTGSFEVVAGEKTVITFRCTKKV